LNLESSDGTRNRYAQKERGTPEENGVHGISLWSRVYYAQKGGKKGGGKLKTMERKMEYCATGGPSEVKCYDTRPELTGPAIARDVGPKKRSDRRAVFLITEERREKTR